jgi:hypothetical protein
MYDILLWKWNNMYDTLLWKWNKIALNDDGNFIASCIKFFIVKKIQQCTIEKNLHVSNACSLILGL